MSDINITWNAQIKFYLPALTCTSLLPIVPTVFEASHLYAAACTSALYSSAGKGGKTIAPSCRTCRRPGRSCTGIPSWRLSHRIVGEGLPSAVHGIVTPVELEKTDGLGGSTVKTGGR